MPTESQAKTVNPVDLDRSGHYPALDASVQLKRKVQIPSVMTLCLSQHSLANGRILE